jgi:hypothetical protein
MERCFASSDGGLGCAAIAFVLTGARPIDRAGRRLDYAGQQLQQRRFSATVMNSKTLNASQPVQIHLTVVPYSPQ